MSEQETLRLVQQFYAAFKGGDINGALKTLSKDVGWFIPGPKDVISFAGQRQGRSRSRSSSQNLRTCRTQTV